MEKQQHTGREIQDRNALGSWHGEQHGTVCSQAGLGTIKGERLMLFVLVFAQLSDLDLNLQSNWEPFKCLNLGNDMILIAFLHNYSRQYVKDE